MKRLLRRLSRVADSYCSSSPSTPLLPRSKPSRAGRRRSYYIPHPDDLPVPAGHLPLRVEDPDGGGTPRRFVVPAELLTAPIIAALLRRSAEEYGYEQSGVLRIPCPVDVFQDVLDSLLAPGQKQQGVAAGGVGDLFSVTEDGNKEWGFWEEAAAERRDLGSWAPALHCGAAECCWCC